MGMGFAIEFLVLLLMAASTTAAADASGFDDQNDPDGSFDDFSESKEDEILQDLSRVVERLLLRKLKATCRQGDTWESDRETDEVVRTSNMNFDAYDNVEEEEPQSNRFDGFESQQLQSDINAQETGQIGSQPFNDFGFQESRRKPEDENDGLMEGRHFEDFSGETQENQNHDNPRGEEGKLVLTGVKPSRNGSAQMERTSFYKLKREGRKPNRTNTPQMKRAKFYKLKGRETLPNSNNSAQMIRTQLYKLKREEALPNDNRSAQMIRTQLYKLKREEVLPNNIDTPQMERAHFDGYRNKLGNLKPTVERELNKAPPNLARASDPLSDFYVDDGIPEEQREVHSNANDNKESSTAEETSSDDLLAMLVSLVRDKRWKESSNS